MPSSYVLARVQEARAIVADPSIRPGLVRLAWAVLRRWGGI